MSERLRILLTEPLDPDGALSCWLSRDLDLLGHESLILPVQELVPRMGIPAWQRLVRAVCRAWRPHVLVVHPPYDFVGSALAGDLRRLGVRVVAFAFDDPVFLPFYQGDGDRLDRVTRSLEARFDLYASTSPAMVEALQQHGLTRVRWLRWAMATPSDETREPVRKHPALVLVGQAYPRRVSLVAGLAARGIRVDVHGHGWSEADLPRTDPRPVSLLGPLSGEALPGVLRQAAGVICPADWEDRPVAMVKARLLEIVLAGGLVLAEATPDLDAYFDDREVLRYRDVDDLVRLAGDLATGRTDGPALAERARARALREHCWRTRWPELVGLLEEAGRPIAKTRRPRRDPEAEGWVAFQQALTQLALDLERREGFRAALGVYRYLVRWASKQGWPVDPAIQAGLGRCLYALGRPETALPVLTPTREGRPAPPSCEPGEDTAVLPLSWPPASNGFGLGRSGHLAPGLENLGYRVAALLDTGRVAEAEALLAGLPDPDWLVGLASILDPAAGPASSAPFWQCLEARLTGARPVLLGRLREDLLRWRTRPQ